MIVQKITNGFVQQIFDTETKQCLGQKFTAGDSEWAQLDDSPINCPDDSLYEPFEMIDPSPTTEFVWPS